ncbi:MAG: hypothetical protein C5B52_09305 [Bacteroidetes bacterium]|nr:MAG: hypothetical protein C5B52_09305 [Bacteroidota bacterium]
MLWLSRKTAFSNIESAVKIAFLLGALSAVVSCISGLFLSANGEYDEATLSWHKWMGLSVALISSICYLSLAHLKSFPWQSLLTYISGSVLFILIFVTGHLGGTLTHGEGFLTQPLETIFRDTIPKAAKKIIRNVQEASVYNDILQPMFQNKCYGCHSSVKQKGGLRMDSREWILKGGKDGDIISAGNPDKSEIYKRLILDPLEEHHMPPKGKPQLTESEIAIIHWWIINGSPFEKKVKELDQPEKMKPILASLQSDTNSSKGVADIPSQKVSPANQTALDELRKTGAAILPVSEGSNYLSANIFPGVKEGNEIATMLEPVSNQLIWLKLNGINLSDSGMRSIGKLTSLIRLSLDNTKITDKGLAQLQGLNHLKYLNLVGTNTSANGVIQLKSLKNIQSIYLYKTKINRAGFEEIKKAFPTAFIDTGGYQVPFLATDTAIVRQVLKPKTGK